MINFGIGITMNIETGGVIMLKLNDEEIYGTLIIKTIVCGKLDEHGRERYAKKVTLLSVRGLSYGSALEAF